MSGIKDKTNPSVPDAKLTDEDKFEVYESCDSGFISSANLIVSGEISSDIVTSEEADHHPKGQMRLDSGVDLSESFSDLKIQNPDLNDLSCTKKEQALDVKPPVEDTTAKDDLWKEYFQQDEDGDTFLHLAIAQGFIEVVLALIRMAPHPLLLDTPNDNAQTPIHLAASMRNPKMVRWLVVAGAKPSPRNIRGDSPLHIAARNGDVSCCKAIIEPVQEHERIALGLSYPKQPYQELNLDQWNYEGQTCVHAAAISGQIEVLRHLVWYGADINAREGRQGYTALHYAVEMGNERLAHFLLSECRKLNADAVTYGGNSVLQLGFPVSSPIAEALKCRGVPSPFTSDDEEDSESETELPYERSPIFVHNLVDASA